MKEKDNIVDNIIIDNSLCNTVKKWFTHAHHDPFISLFLSSLNPELIEIQRIIISCTSSSQGRGAAEETFKKSIMLSQGICKSCCQHCLKDFMETAIWDIALERGVKGNKDNFREVCCPASCFEYVLCKSHVPSTTTCFEHACEEHPVQMQVYQETH